MYVKFALQIVSKYTETYERFLCLWDIFSGRLTDNTGVFKKKKNFFKTEILYYSVKKTFKLCVGTTQHYNLQYFYDIFR
jgi:hypothetical protein